MNKTNIHIHISDTESQKELIKVLKFYNQRIYFNSDILRPNFIGYVVYSDRCDEWCSGSNSRTSISISKLKEYLKNEQDEQRVR
jgi:hypothetical protein